MRKVRCNRRKRPIATFIVVSRWARTIIVEGIVRAWRGLTHQLGLGTAQRMDSDEVDWGDVLSADAVGASSSSVVAVVQAHYTIVDRSAHTEVYRGAYSLVVVPSCVRTGGNKCMRALRHVLPIHGCV